MVGSHYIVLQVLKHQIQIGVVELEQLLINLVLDLEILLQVVNGLRIRLDIALRFLLGKLDKVHFIDVLLLKGLDLVVDQVVLLQYRLGRLLKPQPIPVVSALQEHVFLIIGRLVQSSLDHGKFTLVDGPIS